MTADWNTPEASLRRRLVHAALVCLLVWPTVSARVAQQKAAETALRFTRTGTGGISTAVALAPPLNQAPTVTAGPDQFTFGAPETTLDGAVVDDGLPDPPAAVTALWSVVSGPGTVIFGNASAVDTTAAFTASGTYVLRLTASDSTLSSFDDVRIRTSPNSRPMVSAGNDQTIAFPAAVALAGTVSDDGLPDPPAVVTTTWTMVSGPGTLVFANAAALQTTASFSSVGTYVLRLSANDSALIASDDVAITAAANQPPAVNAGPDRTISEKLAAVNPNLVEFISPDHDTLLPVNGDSLITKYFLEIWARDVNPSIGQPVQTHDLGKPPTVPGTDRVVVDRGQTFLALAIGDRLVATVRASGPAGDARSAISNPFLNLSDSAPPPETLVGASVVLGGSSIIDDGLPASPGLTSTWSQVSGPGTVTFGNPAASGTGAVFPSLGTYVLRLTASDGLLTASDDLTVTVVPPHKPPTVNAGEDQTIAQPLPATLDGFVADDGLPIPPGGVTVAWTQVSGPGVVVFGNAAAVDTTAFFSVNGTYALRLTASDGELSALDEVTITVNNFPPGVSAGLNLRITLPAAALLDGTVADDGLPNPPGFISTTWSVVAGPGVVALPHPFAVDTTARFFVPGVYVLRLTATDGAHSGSADVTITVYAATGINQAPTASAGPDQALSLPAFAALHGTIADDALPNPPSTVTTLWSMVSGPGTVTFADAGAVDTTANFSTAGTYVLRLSVNDTALSGSDDVTILVTEAPPFNQPPVVTAGPDRTVTLPESAALDGTVVDDQLPNPAALSSMWSVVSGPGPVTFGNVTAVDTTASFVTRGVYILRLTATDGVFTDSDTVTVTVAAPNQPPSVTAGSDKKITLPAVPTIIGTVGDDGLPGPLGSVTTVWSMFSGPGTVTFENATALGTTASFSAAGVYVLRLTANDGSLSAFDDVAVTVDAINQSPSVNAGADSTIADGTNLAGIVSDDGFPNPPGLVRTVWSIASGPGPVTFANAIAVNTPVSFWKTGTYVLRLTATDNELIASDDVTVTVTGAGLPPLVHAGLDQAIVLPAGATLDGTVTDDGYPQPPAEVTTFWSVVSGPGTVTIATATAVDTTVSFSTAGTYVLRLTASDSESSVSDEMTVVVIPANETPTVNAGLDQTTFLPAAATLDGTATDDGKPNPPGAVATLWSVVSGPGTVSFANAAAIDTTASFSTHGTYLLRLTVSDGALSSADDIVIVVFAATGRPVADFDGDGRNDFALYRRGMWLVENQTSVAFGIAGDVPVPGDYDGDGRTERAVFRPADGVWYISGQAVPWGAPEDWPVPADYNGDGRTDIAVFRPSTGTWYVRGEAEPMAWGIPGDLPVPADYTGDGRADIAVFRPSTSTWYILGFSGPAAFGIGGDVPVPADYNGDGRAEIAVFRPSTGTWFVAGLFTVGWGGPGDLPLGLDLDANGRAELVVYRRETGTWYGADPFTGSATEVQQGGPGDLPALVRPWMAATVAGDIDGDRRADLTVFRPSSAVWFTPQRPSQSFGEPGDLPALGDYLGIGRNQLATYRPVDGTWRVANGPTVQLGVAGGVPVSGDYDGDLRTDMAVWTPANGVWQIRRSSTDGQVVDSIGWGAPGDIPVPGDYDGDRKTDLAVFRPTTGVWHILFPATGIYIHFAWGIGTDRPVPSDFDGDGRTDVAIWRPDNGGWFILRRDGAVFVRWGAPGDVPVLTDFDGDRRTDIVIFRPTTGAWWVFGQSASLLWGAPGDIPLPKAP